MQLFHVSIEESYHGEDTTALKSDNELYTKLLLGGDKWDPGYDVMFY